jgi:hypothetical protein
MTEFSVVHSGDRHAAYQPKESAHRRPKPSIPKERIMKAILHTAHHEVQPAQAPLSKTHFIAFFPGIAFALILVFATLHFFAVSERDSVVRRCDASALATVGPFPTDTIAARQRQWRQDRKLAFERCSDASFLAQNAVNPRP